MTRKDDIFDLGRDSRTRAALRGGFLILIIIGLGALMSARDALLPAAMKAVKIPPGNSLGLPPPQAPLKVTRRPALKPVPTVRKNIAAKPPRLKAAEAKKKQKPGPAATTKPAVTQGEKKTDWSREEITGPIPGVYLQVFLSRRLVGLCVGRKYVRVYRDVAVAKDVGKGKSRADDGLSPIGKYYICARDEEGGRLKISYPSAADAKAAKARGAIDETAYRKILAASKARQEPPQDTPLGGGVWLTGQREAADATNGAIALRPEELREIMRATRLGAWVVIRP